MYRLRIHFCGETYVVVKPTRAEIDEVIGSIRRAMIRGCRCFTWEQLCRRYPGLAANLIESVPGDRQGDRLPRGELRSVRNETR